MFTITVVCGGRVLGVDATATVKGALEVIRASWMEDEGEGYPVYLVTDREGRVVATVLRSIDDPEIAVTTRAGAGAGADGSGQGGVERHRCRYVVDAAGRWQTTRVTECATGQVKYLVA